MISPLAWALGLLAAGLLLGLRDGGLRVGWGLSLASLVTLWVFATPRVANALLRGLEMPAVTRMRDGVTYDAAILLTGVMDGNATVDHGESAYNESVDRVLVTLDLLRSGRARSVLVTGTSWAPRPGEGDSEARRIAQDLERWGVEPSRIVVEEASRTTRENAVNSAGVIAREGWRTLLLVTSAAHMARARGCFRAVGLDVDTRATDFESYEPSPHAAPLGPSSTALEESRVALHEWVGRIVYRWRGWTAD